MRSVNDLIVHLPLLKHCGRTYYLAHITGCAAENSWIFCGYESISFYLTKLRLNSYLKNCRALHKSYFKVISNLCVLWVLVMHHASLLTLKVQKKELWHGRSDGRADSWHWLRSLQQDLSRLYPRAMLRLTLTVRPRKIPWSYSNKIHIDLTFAERFSRRLSAFIFLICKWVRMRIWFVAYYVNRIICEVWWEMNFTGTCAKRETILTRNCREIVARPAHFSQLCLDFTPIRNGLLESQYRYIDMLGVKLPWLYFVEPHWIWEASLLSIVLQKKKLPFLSVPP